MSENKSMTPRAAVLVVTVTGIVSIVFWSFTEETFISRRFITIDIRQQAYWPVQTMVSLNSTNKYDKRLPDNMQSVPASNLSSATTTSSSAPTKKSPSVIIVSDTVLTITSTITASTVAAASATKPQVPTSSTAATTITRTGTSSTSSTASSSSTAKALELFQQTVPSIESNFSLLAYMFEDPVPKNGLLTVSYNPAMGIGNMMFIYATLLGTAYKYRLYPVMLKQPRFHAYTVLDLHVKEIEGTGIAWTGRGEKLCCAYVPESFKDFANRNNNYRMSEYLQSYKYFDHIREFLRSKEFRFRPDVELKAKQQLANITATYCNNSTAYQNKQCIVVGIHIRRGDIASASMSSYGYVLASRQYFLNAMTHFSTKFAASSRILFAVVGNDFAWNQQNLGNTNFTVALLKPAEQAVDLCFLAICNHLIMSTGTYGWWAGYLSSGDVVYLRDYPRPNSYMASVTRHEDFFLPHWIGLQ